MTMVVFGLVWFGCWQDFISTFSLSLSPPFSLFLALSPSLTLSLTLSSLSEQNWQVPR